MPRLLPAIFLALCLAFATAPAAAWNGAGHRLVAAIAWQQLSPVARERAGELLARHPDHRRWLAKGSADPVYTAFVEAATWPDDIRRDPRFHDHGDRPPTPPPPGWTDTASHPSWHFVDYFPDGRVRAGELDRQLDRLAAVLGNPQGDPGERAYALPWLIHLVADAHQPLHVGSHDDEGGNRVAIEDPFNPRRPLTNLHTWWDDLPGPPWLRGKRLEQAAAALAAAPPPRQGNAGDWLRESRALSRELAYPPPGDGALPVVTDAFRSQSRAIANRRLGEAGHRLGRLLEAALAKVSRGTGSP